MRGLAVLVLMLGSLAVAAAQADTLQLKNGDRLTGTITQSDGKQITIKTDYAGDVKVSWSAVTDVTAAQPLFVAQGKTSVSGTISVEPKDLVVHTAANGDVRVPLTDTTVVRSAKEQQAFEESQHPSLAHNWKGGANLGFALARGNSDTTNLNTGITAERKTPVDLIALYETTIYATSAPPGQASSKATANEILAGARWQRDVSKRLFGFLSADYTHDALQDLNLRSIYSFGPGWHAINTPKTTLDLLGGGNYTRETYGNGANLNGGVPSSAGVERNLAGVTLGENFTRKIGAASVFTEHLFFYPDLTETGEYRIALDGAFVTKINKWLGWQWNVSDRYVSNPPILGTKPNDLIFSTGLNVAFSH
jgi:putative salt-induced outer membrane protein